MAIENMWEIGDHDGSLDDPHILCYSNSFNLSLHLSILLDMNPMKLTTHDTLVY